MSKCYCNLCGNLIESNITMVTDMTCEEEMTVCYHCITNNTDIFYCDGHNRFEMDTQSLCYNVNEYGVICCDFYENSDEFVWCAECDELYHENNVYYNEDCDCYFCWECNERVNTIPSYHSHSYNEFLTNDKNEKQFYGIELEVELERKYSTNKVAEEVTPIIEKEFFMEQDHSLRNGFEMISKPFSYNYMVENLESTIKDLCNKLDNSIDENANTNGMHIHITKQNYSHMFNMVCLVEYYQKQLTILSNRDRTQLRRWASFLTSANDKDLLSERLIESELDDEFRYFACNISNSKTIEVRIFKATNDNKEILGRIELIHNMSEYAKENKINNFKDMPSFYEIATYKENKYVDYLLEKYGFATTC